MPPPTDLNGGKVQFSLVDALMEQLYLQRLCPANGFSGILHAQSDVANAGSARQVGRMCESFPLGIDDDVYRALCPERDVLVDVICGMGESQCRQ